MVCVYFTSFLVVVVVVCLFLPFRFCFLLYFLLDLIYNMKRKFYETVLFVLMFLLSSFAKQIFPRKRWRTKLRFTTNLKHQLDTNGLV